MTSIVNGEELCSESATYEFCKAKLAATQDHAGAELLILGESSTAGIDEAGAEPSVTDEPSGGKLQGFLNLQSFSLTISPGQAA